MNFSHKKCEMKDLLYVVVCFFSLIIVSCMNTDKKNSIEIIGYDNELSLNGENLDIVSFDIIELELSEKSIIDKIIRVEYLDSMFLVQTIDELFAFSNDGAFICRYSSKGKGPGEYLSIYSFVVNSEKQLVYIIDEGARKMLMFSIDGEFICENKFDSQFLPMESHYGISLNDTCMLISNRIYNENNAIYTLFNCQTNDKRIIYWLPVKTDNIAEPIGKSPIAKYKESVKFIVPFENEIFTLNGGNVEPLMTITTTQALLTKEKIKGINNFGINAYVELMNDNYFTGFTSIFETDKYIFLEVLHNLNYFLIDKESNTGKLYDYYVSDKQESLPLINIICSDSKSLIGMGNPIELMEIGEKIANDSDDINLLKLKRHINNISSNSNPSLFIYTLK